MLCGHVISQQLCSVYSSAGHAAGAQCLPFEGIYLGQKLLLCGTVRVFYSHHLFFSYVRGSPFLPTLNNCSSFNCLGHSQSPNQWGTDTALRFLFRTPACPIPSSSRLSLNHRAVLVLLHSAPASSLLWSAWASLKPPPSLCSCAAFPVLLGTCARLSS